MTHGCTAWGHTWDILRVCGDSSKHSSPCSQPCQGMSKRSGSFQPLTLHPISCTAIPGSSTPWHGHQGGLTTGKVSLEPQGAGGNQLGGPTGVLCHGPAQQCGSCASAASRPCMGTLGNSGPHLGVSAGLFLSSLHQGAAGVALLQCWWAGRAGYGDRDGDKDGEEVSQRTLSPPGTTSAASSGVTV